MKDTIPQLPMMSLVTNRKVQVTTMSSTLGVAVTSSFLTTIWRHLSPKALAVRTWCVVVDKWRAWQWIYILKSGNEWPGSKPIDLLACVALFTKSF